MEFYFFKQKEIDSIKIYEDNPLDLLESELLLNNFFNDNKSFFQSQTKESHPTNCEILESKTFSLSLDYNSRDKDIFDRKLVISNLNKKRGRKRLKDKKDIKTHNNFSSDNILKKIQTHYLSFILFFLNEILMNLGYKFRFFSLDYRFKSNIKKEFLKSLKAKTIGDIICNPISNKYKTLDKNINLKTYQEIKNNEVLKKIFQYNYLQLFQDIYYKNNKIVDLKKFGLNKKIQLSNKVKMFEDLLKLHYSNKLYLKAIKKCIINNFLPNSIFLLK